MGFGFVLAHFNISFIGGIALVLLGAAMNLIGAMEYLSIAKRLRSGDGTVPERPIQLATAIAVLLAIAGVVGVVFLSL